MTRRIYLNESRVMNFLKRAGYPTKIGVGRKLSYSKSYIDNVLNGDVPVSKSLLKQIASLAKTSPNKLID